MTALPNEKPHTIADIEALPEDQRAELIDGYIYMQAAPLRIHQRIISLLITSINVYINQTGKPCQAYTAPFAVYLDADYVEPDISVICDPSKLTDKGCVGAPDWIIEIISPSSVTLDYIRKLALYERAGVREYWIVNPNKQTVRTYDLENNDTNDYSFSNNIPVRLCEDFRICIEELLR